MKNILSVLILASMLFTSCKKEETTEEAVTEEVAIDTTDVAVDSLATASVPSTPQTGAKTNSVMYSQPTTGSTAPPPPPQAVAKGMNPPHGQPGHRCDISVGAPLNSPPGKKTTATPESNNVTQATTVTPAMLNQSATPSTTSPATPVVTAPGMNPPHGQEGHVCSVAVGAPLPKN